MAQRYVIPPETENEKFAIGLDMGQLMWLGGGIALGFGAFMLASRVISSLLFNIAFGILAGTSVAPFMFIKPKERSMTLIQYFRLKYKVKTRNNVLPNRTNREVNRSRKNIDSDKDTTDSGNYAKRRDVRDIDITLGGGQ